MGPSERSSRRVRRPGDAASQGPAQPLLGGTACIRMMLAAAATRSPARATLISDIMGWLILVFACVVRIPQVWKVFRAKNAEGLCAAAARFITLLRTWPATPTFWPLCDGRSRGTHCSAHLPPARRHPVTCVVWRQQPKHHRGRTHRLQHMCDVSAVQSPLSEKPCRLCGLPELQGCCTIGASSHVRLLRKEWDEPEAACRYLGREREA